MAYPCARLALIQCVACPVPRHSSTLLPSTISAFPRSSSGMVMTQFDAQMMYAVSAYLSRLSIVSPNASLGP